MKKLFRIILVIVFTIVLRVFYGWSVRAFEMSGTYITETASMRIFGKEVDGTIEKISRNDQITVSNNYLATVSYMTLDNQKITEDFRYAEEKMPVDTKVHILYDSNGLLKAALKEDANYFKYTFYSILGFVTLFALLLGTCGYIIYRLGKPKSNTIS